MIKRDHINSYLLEQVTFLKTELYLKKAQTLNLTTRKNNTADFRNTILSGSFDSSSIQHYFDKISISVIKDKPEIIKNSD